MAIEVCKLGDLPQSGAIERRVSLADGIRDLILLMTPAGPRAYLDVCPHQGRSLAIAPGEFLFTGQGDLMCPHHGACFDPATGACVSGPCEGDRLTRVAIRVTGDALCLDD